MTWLRDVQHSPSREPLPAHVFNVFKQTLHLDFSILYLKEKT